MLKIEQLTDNEKLFIKRRRNCYSQGEMATWLGISYTKYSKMETGKDAFNKKVYKFISDIELELTDIESCLILRRRNNKTLNSLAKELKCCKYWLNLMELGKKPADPLINYWRNFLGTNN